MRKIATNESVQKAAKEIVKTFPVSMNMLAGNEEKARKIAEEKKDAGKS